MKRMEACRGYLKRRVMMVAGTEAPSIKSARSPNPQKSRHAADETS